MDKKLADFLALMPEPETLAPLARAEVLASVLGRASPTPAQRDEAQALLRDLRVEMRALEIELAEHERLATEWEALGGANLDAGVAAAALKNARVQRARGAPARQRLGRHAAVVAALNAALAPPPTNTY